MSEAPLRSDSADAEETIRMLQEELAETNRGLVALALELESRVDARTAELREAHAELERTNSELVQLTLELEDRVDHRTKELQIKTEELRAMSQQLWQAAKLATMGELAASVAHELNNPLATVILHLETLREEADPASSGARRLEVIEGELDRMAQLVANLLQFSRPGQRQISTLDIHEELEKTLEIIHYVFRKRKVQVERAYAAGLPMIHADRQKLRQVFLNLLINAADAMPDGGTLTLRTAPTVLPDAKPAIMIEAADTGMGIPAENLPRITDPFFTTKPEGKGTGLGLAICRRIVQEHHGTMEFASEVGKGTAVRITLPVANGTNGREAAM
jgi:signal transduction histidine kinase